MLCVDGSIQDFGNYTAIIILKAFVQLQTCHLIIHVLQKIYLIPFGARTLPIVGHIQKLVSWPLKSVRNIYYFLQLSYSSVITARPLLFPSVSLSAKLGCHFLLTYLIIAWTMFSKSSIFRGNPHFPWSWHHFIKRE